MFDEITEYPYTGVVKRIIQGTGRNPDREEQIYSGEMDAQVAKDEQGNVAQTSEYIVCMPLTTNQQGQYIIPKKGDKISLTQYGVTFEMVVNNADPSQLGGITVYATRTSW